MRRSLLILSSLASLAFLFPSLAAACQTPCVSCYPAPLGKTSIVGISPQVGIAGITWVYVNGYCFGDSQGGGSVTVNGETMNDIESWSDAEIIFVLPFDAATGDLKVSSSSYGSDDSANESQRTNRGNNNINANFTVKSPNNPPLCCVPGTCPPAPYVSGAPSVPQYVTGTWNYNDGVYVETITLTQGAQNPDGTWTVTGSYTGFGPCGSSPPNLWLKGILDQYGDLVLTDQCDGTQRIWRILDSGDVTSQGYGAIICPFIPSSEYQYFLQEMTNTAEGPYYYCEVPPLFKSQTDIPSVETPAPQGWEVNPYSGSQHPTYGRWTRSFALLNGFVGYPGRFVFEQSGTGATDTCWTPLSPTGKNTGVTGGGWFVNQMNVWGYDDIGMRSQGVDWYQNNVTLPCQYTSQQNMYIDTMNGPSTLPYTTNQLTFQIQSTKIYSEVQEPIGGLVKECENYPSLKGNCKP